MINKMIYKIKDTYYNIKYGIQNLIKYAPTIWKDRDFDHFYFHDIMKQKLIFMEKFFRSDYAWGENSIKDADNIRIAINLLERICNENIYVVEARSIANIIPEIEIYKKSNELQEKDYDELYKILKDNIRCWWD